MDVRSAAQAPISAPVRRLSELPGPAGVPLLGNLSQLDLPRMHAQFEAWSAVHGPSYRVRLGRRDVLVVSSPEVITSLLRDRPEGWRRMRAMADVIREMGSHGLFSAEGEDWHRQRRLVMGAFDPAHLKRYFPSLVRVTERLRRRLDQAARTDERVDLQDVMTSYTVDVTAGLAFGIDVNTLEVPEDVLRGHMKHIFPMLMKRMNAPFPWWRYLRLPSDRAFERHLAAVHEAVLGFVRAGRERIERNPDLLEHPTNLLEAMLAALEDGGGRLSDDEVAGNVFTVLLAGEDTTANTLVWALHHLYENPQAWAQLVSVVDAALGEDDLPRTFESTRELGFIEDCVNETMRLRPVAPIIFLESNGEKVVDGVAVPPDTLVFCLMRPGAVDAAKAPDAAAFRPSRWQEASAPDAGPTDGQRALVKASAPFGAGPRLCPGRYLGILEMKMVLATIARNFRLVEVATTDRSRPQERLAFTMFADGLGMRVAPRQ